MCYTLQPLFGLQSIRNKIDTRSAIKPSLKQISKLYLSFWFGLGVFLFLFLNAF